jgi:hypothetical protein
MKKRLFGTVAAFVVYGWVNFFLNTASPIVTNQFAGKQFDDSDAAYVVSQYGIRIMSFTGGISTVLLLTALWLIWRGITKPTETKDETASNPPDRPASRNRTAKRSVLRKN